MSTTTKILLVTIILILLGIIGFVFSALISNIRPGISVKASHLDSLYKLQEIALLKGEYAVGAIIVYNDSIIGSGYNTFRDLNKPLGHAEINAIENVFESIHYRDFKALDRDSLVIITSYEPCMMCKGIINQLDIRKIYYLKPKKTRYRFKYWIKDHSYWIKLRKIKTSED